MKILRLFSAVALASSFALGAHAAPDALCGGGKCDCAHCAGKKKKKPPAKEKKKSRKKAPSVTG